MVLSGRSSHPVEIEWTTSNPLNYSIYIGGTNLFW